MRIDHGLRPPGAAQVRGEQGTGVARADRDQRGSASVTSGQPGRGSRSAVDVLGDLRLERLDGLLLAGERPPAGQRVLYPVRTAAPARCAIMSRAAPQWVMGRKPSRRSPLLRTAPRFPVRRPARPRPRRRLPKLTSIQVWVAIAGIIGSLTSVPALIVSMNALRISEGQRADTLKISNQQQADARRVKTEADEASKRAFLRRIDIGPESDIPKTIISGGTITVSNSNATSTYVMVFVTAWRNEGGERPTLASLVRFAAPACSEVTFQVTPQLPDGKTSGFEISVSRFAFNAIDQRWWYLTSYETISPDPIESEMEAYVAANGWFAFDHPSRKRSYAGCV